MAEQMKRIKVGVHGCDDSTEVEMEVNYGAFLVIQGLVNLVNQVSNGGCEPTMSMEEVNE